MQQKQLLCENIFLNKQTLQRMNKYCTCLSTRRSQYSCHSLTIYAVWVTNQNKWNFLAWPDLPFSFVDHRGFNIIFEQSCCKLKLVTVCWYILYLLILSGNQLYTKRAKINCGFLAFYFQSISKINGKHDSSRFSIPEL